MIRMKFGLAALVLSVAAAGCSMCAHPYDYSGPVYPPGPPQPVVPRFRAGSAFPIITPASGTLSPAESEREPKKDLSATEKTTQAPAPEANEESRPAVRPKWEP